jgi:hypothetical protein
MEVPCTCWDIQRKKELVIGEGKVVIGTDNLIKLSTEG